MLYLALNIPENTLRLEDNNDISNEAGDEMIATWQRRREESRKSKRKSESGCSDKELEPGGL